MLLSLWDDLLDDPALLAAVREAQAAYRLIDRSTFFWYARPLAGPDAPTNPLEDLAERVIDRVRPARLAGVEYWSNSLETGARMHPHVDKDERLFWSTKEVRHPLISTVFYPGPTAFAGGELVIDNRHLVSPGANQLVAFRGTLTHAVQAVKSGTRVSIALNLWAETPTAYGEGAAS